MQDFRNLQVWQKAHELTLMVYDLTQDFPKRNCSASGIRSGERAWTFLLTLQKAPANPPMPNSRDASVQLWGWRIGWNISCFSPSI
jgi:hypothetical protein